MVSVQEPGDESEFFFGVPSNLEHVLSNEDFEYWRAAFSILDEIVNHEEIFQAFGPPVRREQHMNVAPTRFLFSQKLVSLDE